jgi:hypothetical protein
MGARLLIANGSMQTTAAMPKVATTNVIKTMLQLYLGATPAGARVIEWGCSFDGSAAATPGEVELIETDVGATVTAYVAADITALNAEALALSDGQKLSSGTTGLLQGTTATSGFTSSAEGSITSVRNLDAPQLIAPTTQFVRPLGTDVILQSGKYLRIRVTFGTTVNMYCWICLEF